jgi:membrane-bound ClpP family serine protease
MELPEQPVTLTAEQIAELNRKLSIMRHDVNNNLALIIAAAEVVRYKPHLADKMMATLSEQPPKIGEAIAKFSAEFEKLFGISRQ